MTVTDAQRLALTRAAVLLGRHGAVLSDFERQLVDDCVHRLRDQGQRMTLTANEWTVIEEAVGAMEASRDDAARNATVIVGHVARPSSFKGVA